MLQASGYALIHFLSHDVSARPDPLPARSVLYLDRDWCGTHLGRFPFAIRYIPHPPHDSFLRTLTHPLPMTPRVIPAFPLLAPH